MGRPDLTAHTFRHTYMTVSARCGENLDEIQSEVGHGYASDVITEYLHQTEESRCKSAVRRQEYLMNIMERYGAEDGSR
jgi:integrase